MDNQTGLPVAFSNIDLFAGMEKRELVGVLGAGSKRTFEAGAVVFREGDPAQQLFLVEKGRLKLSRLHEDGSETIIRYVNPGEMIAEISLNPGKELPVTAQAIGRCDVVAWDRDTMVGLLQDHPRLGINMLCAALERVDDLQRRFIQLRAERVEQRIAKALLRIVEQSGWATDEGVEIAFPLSRQDLADYTGTTLYTVSRTLSSWEKKGWIRSGRERILVLNPHALVDFSENG